MPIKSFAAVGHPISQSLSPAIYMAAFKYLDLDYKFEAVDVFPENLAEFLKSEKYEGLSVTIPHKEKIIPLTVGKCCLARLLPNLKFLQV
ncbi:MAG: hypothetical protein PHF79_02430 [Candidatus Pacebacteria bacterium]|nr:hypothetical protein [Candidatus Paceibacterota bacterium]